MPPRETTSGPSRPRARAHVVLLFAIAAVAYANTLPNLPVLDDGWAVFENPLVKDLRRIPDVLREPWGVAGPPTVRGAWRPLTTVTFALNYAVHGRMVGGYHLVNLLLHALATVAVWALARRLVSALAPERAAVSALVAGAIFAVHPVHVEAVAGIVGRAELLSTLLVLCALLALAWLGRWRLAVAAALGFAALLAKENAATAPALAALAIWAAPGAFGLARRPGLGSAEARRAALFFVAAAGALAATVVLYLLVRPVPFSPREAQWFAGQPRATVLFTMSRALAEYLRLLVFPHPLGVDFYYANQIPMTHAVNGAVVVSTAAWTVALALGLVLLWRRPLWGAGILWVYAALLPVLNLVAPVGVLLAERLLYLPSVGFCLAAGDATAAALAALPPHHPTQSNSSPPPPSPPPTQSNSRRARFRPGAANVAAALLTLVLAALAAKTVARNAEWRNALTLWEAELAKAPRDPTVNNNLAVEYSARGDHRRALERVEVALQAAPSYWRAHVNHGIALQRLGDSAGAERDFRDAARLAPDAPEPSFFLGAFYLEQGRPADALLSFERAEKLGPLSARTLMWKAEALARLGRTADAAAARDRALALDPEAARQGPPQGVP